MAQTARPPPLPSSPRPAGAPFDPHFVLRRSVSNVICSVVFGERFAYDDGNFQVLLDLIQENFRLIDTAWVQVGQAGEGRGGLPGQPANSP